MSKFTFHISIEYSRTTVGKCCQQHHCWQSLSVHTHHGAVVSGERRGCLVECSGIVENVRVEHWTCGTQSLCTQHT